ncbi:MAG TPA: DUF1385 domain-containing protein [Candidatus Acidoferrum sp.]|nr:DUF1385 domain-containing protein [Candidatus Acidoferrum sp.]
MRRLRNYLRFLAAVQLLPALESGEETLVGGQAVLEGVMMRSPHAWAIACRKPSGEVVTMSEPLERPSEKHKWMGWPIVRGVMTLGYAMNLGYRALRFSANVAIEDMMQAPEDEKDPLATAATTNHGTTNHGETTALAVGPAQSTAESSRLQKSSSESREKAATISNWLAAVNILISLAFFIFMYKYIPLLAATELKKIDPALGGRIVFNLIDGGIRLVLFLLFIWGVSLWKDIRRVYQYHGAEHKTVFAFENGDPLSTAAVQKYSTYHPRCGTSFLMTVMLISIGFYMLVPFTTFWARFASRIALLPIIAGVSYEIIRFAAKHRGSLFALMTAPGLWLQRITTKPPTDEQAQCAIAALDQAMALEQKRGGELVIA